MGHTEMSTRRLGNAGPNVSIIGLGTNNFGWRIGLSEARAVVDAAVDEGVTVFDTADVYGETRSEAFLGRVLKRRRHHNTLIITKFGYPIPGAPEAWPRGASEYVRWAIEGSLRRLQTDTIDIYMYHCHDGETPLAETMGALGELVCEGKVRWVGISTADASYLSDAAEAASRDGTPLVCVESRYSLVYRHAENGIIPACNRLGLSLIPFYPLESGLLTGKYRRAEPPPPDSRFSRNPVIWPGDRWLTEEVFDKIDALEGYAVERGLTLLEVALGGLAAQPSVACVIAGATTPEQVQANVRASRWEPTEDDLAALNALGSCT